MYFQGCRRPPRSARSVFGSDVFGRGAPRPFFAFMETSGYQKPLSRAATARKGDRAPGRTRESARDCNAGPGNSALDFCCNMRHVTHVIPFQLVARPGEPIADQVVFAAKKAIFSGKLHPGDPFPSVRALGRAMKIHANTAQKVISQLASEGLLDVLPGIGTVVSSARRTTARRTQRPRPSAGPRGRTTGRAGHANRSISG